MDAATILVLVLTAIAVVSLVIAEMNSRRNSKVKQSGEDKPTA